MPGGDDALRATKSAAECPRSAVCHQGIANVQVVVSGKPNLPSRQVIAGETSEASWIRVSYMRRFCAWRG